MYLDDIKALKNKLEKQLTLYPNNRKLQPVHVTLNRLELEFLIEQISYLTRRG